MITLISFVVLIAIAYQSIKSDVLDNTEGIDETIVEVRRLRDDIVVLRSDLQRREVANTQSITAMERDIEHIRRLTQKLERDRERRLGNGETFP